MQRCEAGASAVDSPPHHDATARKTPVFPAVNRKENRGFANSKSQLPGPVAGASRSVSAVSARQTAEIACELAPVGSH